MSDSRTPNFWVRNVPVYGDVVLAPMDGYSDLPFRATAREAGSAMSYTEFINAIDVVYTHPHLEQRLAYLESERPVVYQGTIVPRRVMNLSSSFDHRFVDGHDGAAMIQALKERLEHPATIFM